MTEDFAYADKNVKIAIRTSYTINRSLYVYHNWIVLQMPRLSVNYMVRV